MSQYTKDFQIQLVSHLATDKEFFKTYSGTVRVSDFELPACQLIWESVKDYYRQYRELPNLNTLQIHVMRMLDDVDGNTITVITPEEYESLAYVLSRTAECYVPSVRNTQYYKDCLVGYLKFIRIGQLTEKYAGGLNPGYGTNNFAQEVIQVNKEVDISYDDDVDGMLSNPQPRLYKEDMVRVPTGIERLDYLLDGGLELGKLGMITACPGVGKTNTQVNFLDAAIVRGGHRGLFITCEMSGAAIKYRYQSIAAGIPASNFKRAIEEWNPQVCQQWDRVVAPDYRFLDYPSLEDFSEGNPTMSRIENAIVKWKERYGKKYGDKANCNLVCVDWLDQIHLDGKAPEKDHEMLKKLIYELSYVARRQNVALWTATQGNREADGQEVLQMRHTSGAYLKSAALDVGLGLGLINSDDTPVDDTALFGRIPDDDHSPLECDRKLMFSITKNREGAQGNVPIYQGPTLKYWNDEQESQFMSALTESGKLNLIDQYQQANAYARKQFRY